MFSAKPAFDTEEVICFLLSAELDLGIVQSMVILNQNPSAIINRALGRISSARKIIQITRPQDEKTYSSSTDGVKFESTNSNSNIHRNKQSG